MFLVSFSHFFFLFLSYFTSFSYISHRCSAYYDVRSICIPPFALQECATLPFIFYTTVLLTAKMARGITVTKDDKGGLAFKRM